MREFGSLASSQMVNRSRKLQLFRCIANVLIEPWTLHLTDAVVIANDIHGRNTSLAHSQDAHVPPYRSNTMERSII